MVQDAATEYWLAVACGEGGPSAQQLQVIKGTGCINAPQDAGACAEWMCGCRAVTDAYKLQDSTYCRTQCTVAPCKQQQHLTREPQSSGTLDAVEGN
jgi:hypothetical protein